MNIFCLKNVFLAITNYLGDLSGDSRLSYEYLNIGSRAPTNDKILLYGHRAEVNCEWEKLSELVAEAAQVSEYETKEHVCACEHQSCVEFLQT